MADARSCWSARRAVGPRGVMAPRGGGGRWPARSDGAEGPKRTRVLASARSCWSVPPLAGAVPGRWPARGTVGRRVTPAGIGHGLNASDMPPDCGIGHALGASCWSATRVGPRGASALRALFCTRSCWSACLSTGSFPSSTTRSTMHAVAPFSPSRVDRLRAQRACSGSAGQWRSPHAKPSIVARSSGVNPPCARTRARRWRPAAPHRGATGGTDNARRRLPKAPHPDQHIRRGAPTPRELCYGSVTSHSAETA